MVDPPRPVRKAAAIIVFGVLLGSLLGAPFGAFLLTPKTSLRNHPDPQAKVMAIFLYPLEVFLTTVGLCLGVAVGGTMGGIAASLAQGRGAAASRVPDSEDDGRP